MYIIYFIEMKFYENKEGVETYNRKQYKNLNY